MRIRLEALGCRLNEAELQRWARQFQALGHQPSVSGANHGRPVDAPSDLVIVNTCAVTSEAVRKSRQLLRRVQRHNPTARLVVSGCATALQSAGIEPKAIDLTGIDLLVSNADKDRLVEIVQRELSLPTMPVSAATQRENPLFARGRQRAFVKIQDGCRHQCSFCVTTLARGGERSRARAEILTEVRDAVAAGVKEAVLTGVHATGYGSDTGDRLEHLIAALLRETDIARLRLGSVEPWGLGEDFWCLFENPRLAPHLHLPLQSGSDRVLRRMGRRCTVAAYGALVANARASIPDFNLSTDMIVGFPGETDADWHQSLATVAAIGFSHVHIFSYSPRPGTRAAELPDQVPHETKRERARQLHQLVAEMKSAVFARYIGRTMDVLLESGVAGSKDPRGYTPNYLPVRLKREQAAGSGGRATWLNRILPLTLIGIDTHSETLIGSPTSP